MKIQLSVGIFLLFSTCIHAQQADSILSKTDQIVSFPGRLFSHIQRKTAALNASLDRQTEKYLDKLQRKEDRFRRRLMQKDSAAAALLAASSAEYSTIQNKITATDTSAKGALSGEYLPYVDSLKGSLAFLQQNSSALDLSPAAREALSASMGQFNELQRKLSATEQAKAFIARRKEQMKQELLRYANDAGLRKYLDAYNREAYYYSEQVREYREMLNDPG